MTYLKVFFGRMISIFSCDFTNCLTSGYSKPVSINTAGVSGNTRLTKSNNTVLSLPPLNATKI